MSGSEFQKDEIIASVPKRAKTDISLEFARQEVQGPGHNNDDDVMSQVFSNELILDRIFEHLRPHHFFNTCRFVNRLWKRAADKSLRNKWNELIEVNLLGVDADGLEEVLEKGELNLPFGGIRLYAYRDHDFPRDYPSWRMLSVVRQYFDRFKRVQLDVTFDDYTFLDYLFGGPFQNVETLELAKVKVNKKGRKALKNETPTDFCRASWKLHKLRSITCRGDPDQIIRKCGEIDGLFLFKLLKSSPNLAGIHALPSSNLVDVAYAGKLDLVSSLRFCGCFDDSIKELSIIPNVSSLTVHSGSHRNRPLHLIDDFIDLGKLLSLLGFVGQSLELLRIENTVVNPSRMTWPEFGFMSLTTLHLTVPVPWPASVSSIFPCLHTVRFDLDLRDRKNHDYAEVANMLWKEPLTSVKCLELRRYINSADMKSLAVVFPEVETVRFDCEHWFKWDRYEDESMSRNGFRPSRIWSVDVFKRLKHLEVFYLPLWSAGVTFDSFVTGFPEYFVKRLREDPSQFEPQGEMTEMMRGEKNLLSLKGLQKLAMYAYLCDSPEAFQKSPSASDVAIRYALNLCPDLELTFLYVPEYRCLSELQTALGPVAHVANFRYRDRIEPF